MAFLFCAFGLLLFRLFFWDRTVSSTNVDDFTGFLIGAKLVGTKWLYDVGRNLDLQKSLTGRTDSAIIFVQLPVWAWLLKPFTLLSYRVSLLLWKTLMAASLVGYCLFTKAPRRAAALALCWSIPAMGAIAMGNNSSFLLLLIGVSLACWRRGWRMLSGIALGLCLFKFHFLVFLPFLLLRRVHRRLLVGFSITAAALLLIDFAVQPNWLTLYWQALNLPQENMNSHATLMPNFYAVFYSSGHPALGTFAGVLLAGTAVWLVCKRLEFSLAMPLCVFGGLLAAPHTNYLDAVLAVPALLGAAASFPRLKALSYVLLSPLGAALYWLGPPTVGPAIFVTASLILLCFLSSARLTGAPS